MNKKLGITVSLLTTIMSCQSINTLENKGLSQDKSFNSQANKFQDILQEKEISCSREKGFSVKAEKSDEFSKENQDMLKQETLNSVNAGPNIEKPRFAENPPADLPYVEIQREIDPNLRNSERITLKFKDQYKIRIARMMKDKTEEEKNLSNIEYDEKVNGKVEDFISLVDKDLEDLKTINCLFKKYNVVNLYNLGVDRSEVESQEDYIKNKAANGYATNERSIYYFAVKDINVKEFIDTLRTLNIVRFCDIELEVVAF